MSGERALPGLGLKAYWTLGSNGWKPDMDENLRKLSVLCQAAVLDRVASLPGSPANGDIYLLTSGAHDKEIAFRDNGLWAYYLPTPGLTIWSVADISPYTYDGTVWVVTGGDLSLYQLRSEKSQPGGYPRLNGVGRVPRSQIPSFTDDVLNYDTLGDFPPVGTAGKLYIADDTGLTYSWDVGTTAYVSSSSMAGTTDLLPEGSVNLYHTVARVRAVVLTGLSLASSAAITATDTVLAALGQLQAQVTLRAPVASPALTGTPAAPTAAPGTNTTQLATTAFVTAAVIAGGSGPANTDALTEGSTNLYFTAARVRAVVLTGLSLASSAAITATDTVLAALGQLQAQVTLRALIAGPTFTGVPAAPTAAVGTNTTQLATTAFVQQHYPPDTFALSDETTSIAAGTAKLTHRVVGARTLTAVRINVKTAPTGSTIIVDIKKNGASIFTTTLVSIDATEKTSVTAAAAYNLTTTAFADDDEITWDITQVGSTIPGVGLKGTLIWA